MAAGLITDLSRTERMRAVRRTLWTILALNLAVAVAKLTYGLATRSVAMTADGYHSFFDGSSNVIGLLGLALAVRPADPDHPYGYSKYETFASAAIGGMLVVAAWNVGRAAIERLVNDAPPARVDALSFVVMVSTLVVNIVITVSERRIGRRLRSDILIADAAHTGSDVLVSLGVIAGLAAVRLGWPAADPIIALGVAAMIFRTAVAVLRQANETLSDRARIPAAAIRQAVTGMRGVRGVHAIRTRGTAAEVYVDLHLQVDPACSVTEAHEVAGSVQTAIRRAFPMVVDVLVHLEPDQAGGEDVPDPEPIPPHTLRARPPGAQP